MKRILLILHLSAFCLCSCIKDNDSVQNETITKGSKWNLEIDSSPADVYSQLQTLGKEKNFSDISINRKPYLKPEDIQNLVVYYDIIGIQSNQGVIDGANINFPNDTVSSIDAGNAMLDSVSLWPQDVGEEQAIQVGDSVPQMYQRLLGIFQIPKYSSYQIFLGNTKPLHKPFDPDMANFEDWGFGFLESITTEISRDYSVELFFKDDKLVKIISSFRDLKMTP